MLPLHARARSNGGKAMPEDRGLQEVRRRYRETAGALGEAAIDFTEGGRSAIFWVGMKQKGDQFLEGVARVCTRVFTDEREHREAGAGEVAAVARAEEDWAGGREGGYGPRHSEGEGGGGRWARRVGSSCAPQPPGGSFRRRPVALS